MVNNPNAFLVFVKHPTPGRVKTRLARDLGEEQAARVYRAMAEHFFSRLREIEHSDCTAYYDPPEEEEAILRWLGSNIHYRPQCPGDLGARLRYGLGALLVRYDRVIALGTDSPDLPLEYVREALYELQKHDVVLGPSEDGGYYLIGLSTFLPNLFNDIPWSTSDVLEETLAQCADAGASVYLLPPWYDVDEIDDLQRLARSTAPEIAALAREVKEALRNKS